MAKRRQVYEGRGKILFEDPEPGTLVLEFKGGAFARKTRKRGIITGKGVLNNRISEYLMQRVAEIGVPTHFQRRLNMREQLVHPLEMMPITVIVRKFVAGTLAERFAIPEGTPLPRSIVEFYFKSENQENPMVTEEHITTFGWAHPHEIDEIQALLLRSNDFLSGLYLGFGLRLIDVNLEFGQLLEGDHIRIVLTDEISPDNSRLLDLNTNEPMDKDRFCQNLGRVKEAYQEIATRLGILPQSSVPDLNGPKIIQ